jgi:hypothetical protein
VTGNRTNPGAKDIIELERINRDYLEELNQEKQKKPTLITDLPDKMNIDSFCMKYSSDELESLKEIIHKDKMKRLNKHFWIYEQEYKHNEQIKALKDYSQEYLSLPPGEGDKQFKMACKITHEFDAKNSLFFPPDYSNTNNRVEMNENKLQSLQMISNQSQAEKSKNENSFSTFSSNLESLKDKQVLAENTRLPENFVESMSEKHSSKMRKKIFEAYESSDVVRLLKELKEIDEKQEKDKNSDVPQSTPIINGYKLVKDPKLDKAAIFTWGEIAATPNVLSKEPRFSVQQTPRREDLAHSLANKTSSVISKQKKLDET